MLCGTVYEPTMHLWFDTDDTHLSNGRPLTEVMGVIGAVHDPEKFCWTITSFPDSSASISSRLERAGFGHVANHIETDELPAWVPTDIDSFVKPLVTTNKAKTVYRIRQRMASAETMKALPGTFDERGWVDMTPEQFVVLGDWDRFVVDPETIPTTVDEVDDDLDFEDPTAVAPTTVAVVSNQSAVVSGTFLKPLIELRFGWDAVHPNKEKNRRILDLVKTTPGAKWNPKHERGRCWTIPGLGYSKTSLDDRLIRTGFTNISIKMDGVQVPEWVPSTFLLFDTEVLCTPVITYSARNGMIQVWPRLGGPGNVKRLLPEGVGAWDSEKWVFELSYSEFMASNIEPDDCFTEPGVLEAAKAEEERRSHLSPHAGTVGLAVSLEAAGGAADALIEKVGTVPEWFGLELDPYQVAGALSVVSGHTLLSDEMGLGKGSPPWVKILTPSGWTTYGEVQVGDLVVGSDGKPTRVTGVFPRGELDVFRVTMSDGASVVVDADHLWTIRSMVNPTGYTVETRSLMDVNFYDQLTFIPMVKPVMFDAEPNPPSDPYLAGNILAEFDAADSHIQKAYLYASPSNRMEFLRGMMDVGGDPKDRTYVTKSTMVAEDLTFLVQSLGGCARSETNGVTHCIKFALNSTPETCPFRDKAKAETWMKNAQFTADRVIRSIEPAGRDEVICISVEAEDSLYVTEDFIVTHNTRQAIASAAMVGASRTVVVCPPVTTTGWEREVSASLLHHYPNGEFSEPPLFTGGKNKGKPNVDHNIVVFRAGRKEKELPETGVVIIPDSILSSRDELRAKIMEWEPDVVLVDEAHRAKNTESKRSIAVRDLASVARRMSVAITGTPSFGKTDELRGPLDVAGLLGPVFGGTDKFRTDYCREDQFHGWHTRKQKLPELKRKLDEECWVLRFKSDVATDLPPKRRQTKFLDVDLSGWNEAHKQVEARVDEWLDSFMQKQVDKGVEQPQLPDDTTCQSWSRSKIGLISILRSAAAKSKLPAVIEALDEYMTAHPADENGRYDRPLIIWVHTLDVADALLEQIPKHLNAQAILGATSDSARARIIDDYQAGKVPVLVASLQAASVGITLTSGCDAWFLEFDWTPSINAQAEDRQNRRGQTRPVTCTTWIAAKTLDERIHKVNREKGDVLDVLMPKFDDNVSGISASHESEHGSIGPFEIIEEIVFARRAKWLSGKSAKAMLG
jgi:hypothetical protein